MAHPPEKNWPVRIYKPAYSRHNYVTIMTSYGRVTSSVTWPYDSA